LVGLLASLEQQQSDVEALSIDSSVGSHMYSIYPFQLFIQLLTKLKDAEEEEEKKSFKILLQDVVCPWINIQNTHAQNRVARHLSFILKNR